MAKDSALPLDDKAWLLLQALQADARAPLKALADAAGLSLPATAERINADLREHRGLTKLRVRGLDRVRPVMILMVLAYNLGHLAAVGGLG